MADLNSVEKILVSKYGFTDRGDGTVAAPSGALFDSEQGGYYTETGAAPVVDNASTAPVVDTGGAAPVVDTGGAGTKYLKAEGALTYGALNVSDLSEADRKAISESDRHTIREDGTITFQDSDGSTQVVPQGTSQATVDTSKIDTKALQELADLKFLSQNTGVSSYKLNNAYEALGIDSSDPTAYTKADRILEAMGYKPGSNQGFYGTNSAVDEGAKILAERWNQAPTEEEMIEAGLDPANVSVTNNNVANTAYLQEQLAAKGLTSSNTNASIRTDAAGELASHKADLNTRLADNPYWGEKIKATGSFDNATLDMTEWDLIKKKKKPLVSDVYQKESTTALPANTGVFDYAAGKNVPVQAVPQTVTQQVTPPSYYNEPVPTATKSITDEQAGTFSKQLQTAGLSAVPTTATYKTHYAGTPGLVDPTLYAPVGGGVGPQQVIYENNLGQRMTVTEVNGAPTTYVPPGYVRKGTMQEIAQQQATGMATGGTVRGYAAGGQPQDPMLEAKFRIASMNGYNGPKTNADLNAFANASPNMKAKFNAIGVTMAQGGLAMAQGGSVPNQAMIAGQPHRLAYVNPQEEAMMKAAGGAGAPSYGGIPAYFTIGPGTTVGQTATDPSTGTVYTWNGTSWITDTGYDVGPGMGAVSTDSAATSEYGLTKEQLGAMQRSAVSQTMQPIQAPVSYIQPQAADFVPVDAGQAVPIAPYAEAATVGTVQQANQQATPVAQTVDFTPAYQQVQAETADLTAAQGQVAPEAQVTAAQQQTSAVTGMQAAQGTATMVDAPAAREIQAGELISGSADAEKAALFNEQIQAATATPSKQATVAGQLEGLMAQFEGGETPAWAAGSMRNAMATLSARGLGASSMAGQAVIQAAMEAALPIAQMDAQVQAQFEGQNLSNRQQRAMLAAQQRATFLGMEFDQDFQSRVQNSARIGDIANMNFTAEQNIALENSRAANTMNLSNLNNRQAMVMAEAAALSQLDTQNLNNRQQAAVQNAQNFMQMDMTNLANEQQTAMFKSQQNIQALFTDQAAENAGKQFNASSQNQTDQYFANLRSQTSQFNASQQNAMDQFNVNSVNALREFNSEIQQQRDLFNAQNGLVIAQSNAQWRQNLSTLNTAAQNQSNSDFAKTMNALTASNMDQIWQRERDLMSFAFGASEGAADRAANIAIAKLTAEEQAKLQDNIGKGQLTAIATQAILKKWL